MELPVAKQSYLPSAEVMTRTVKRAAVTLARTLAEETPTDTANLFIAPARACVAEANFASDLRLPAGTDAAAAVKEIDEAFAAAGARCAWMDSTEEAWPASLAGALEAAGYRAVERIVFVLDAYAPPRKVNAEIQVLPPRSVFGQFRAFAKLEAEAEHRLAGADADVWAQSLVDRLDETRLELFVGRLEQQPVGYAGVLALGNYGVIFPAFTDPNQRGKAIAGTLMAHTIDFCQRSLFERVILERHAGCPAIPFYESLGFKKYASYIRYERH